MPVSAMLMAHTVTALGAAAVFAGGVVIQVVRLGSPSVDRGVLAWHQRLSASLPAKIAMITISAWLVVAIVTFACKVTLFVVAGEFHGTGEFPFLELLATLAGGQVWLDWTAATLWGRSRLGVALSVRGAISVGMLLLFLSVIPFVLYSLPSLFAWACSGHRAAIEGRA